VASLLTDLSVPALARATEENWVAAYCEMFRQWERGRVSEAPGMLWYGCDEPDPQLNGVIHTACSVAQIDQSIARVLADFRSWGVPARWWTFPSTQPDDLGYRLEAHDLERESDLPGMAIDLRAVTERPLSAGVTITQVQSPSEMDQFVQIYATCFGYSASFAAAQREIYAATSLGREAAPWRHYLAWPDGQPVASCTAHLGAGVVGLYDVATMPQTRGRGIGAAITVEALVGARTEGFRAGILQATVMGRPIYERLGFETVCSFGQYRLDAV
jgi:GNAT superfamily N-acetyltransferase